MLIKKIGSPIATAVAVIAFLSWANTSNAALPDDVNAALASGSEAQKVAEIRALALANAGNQENFRQLVQLFAAGSTPEQAAVFAGALGAACLVSSDNAATTRIIISVIVEYHPKTAGESTAAVIASGCSAQAAAGALQAALSAAAGGSLGLVPVLPNNNPGFGVNLLQQAYPKSLNTTRLGNVLEGLQETAMSPTQPNGVPPTTNGEVD